jgi:glycolate dehydrogenase FAD-binding subunit
MLSPSDEAELADCIAGRTQPFEILAAGTKRAVGGPVEAEQLSVARLTGIVDYHPEELVLTARAATPLAQVQALLAQSGQRLAFEPGDLGALLGAPRHAQTLGGVLSANLAGSRRVSAGAARDHFLGFRAVNGLGQSFKAGGKVVKNVTGYDLPKLLAGAWGTLAVLTEVTLRAVPAAERECTLCAEGADVAAAVRTMTTALGSSHEVSAAAFDPVQARAFLRLEGFAPSVAARVASLESELHAALPDARLQRLEGPESLQLWQAIGGVEALADAPVVWRLSVPPTDAVRVVRELRLERYLLDWGGGLIWVAAAEADAARVRGALHPGSHATLLKAPLAVRAGSEVFEPLSPPLAALSGRLKHAFDPNDLFNPGRMR